jgi:hypothetical protein
LCHYRPGGHGGFTYSRFLPVNAFEIFFRNGFYFTGFPAGLTKAFEFFDMSVCYEPAFFDVFEQQCIGRNTKILMNADNDGCARYDISLIQLDMEFWLTSAKEASSACVVSKRLTR